LFQRDTFAAYLKSEGHPAAAKVSKSRLVRLEMPWRTLSNVVDCGVFLMRHMETFKGSSLKEWEQECGLLNEVDDEGMLTGKQQQQLDVLRRKYLAKILLSEQNLSRNVVLQRVREFSLLTDDVKKNMKETAVDRIKEHLATFT